MPGHRRDNLRGNKLNVKEDGMKTPGIARPQATLTVRHLDANEKEIKNRRGLQPRLVL